MLKFEEALEGWQSGRLSQSEAVVLVLNDPAVCEGHARQVERILRKHEQEQEPLIVQGVATFDVLE